MPVLDARELRKSFGTRTILDGVTFTLRSGEKVGLVGRNGSGKSTLARILAGDEPADGGVVSRRRGAQIAWLSQEPALDPAATPREVVTAALAAWGAAKQRHDEAAAALARPGASDPNDTDVERLLAAQAEAAAEVERLGGWDRSHEVDAMLGHLGVLAPDRPVGTLSGGERRRVALAALLVARPHLAILDEPTNHLDVETIEWLETHLAETFPGAVLLVTHDRFLLDRVCTRTLELDDGQLYAYDGGYGEYLEAKAERLAHAARTESNRQNFLRRELEWLARQPKARTTKQKARIERAESAKAAPPPKIEKNATLEMAETRSGKTILELRGLSLDVGGKRLVRGLDLFLTQGERIGVVGRNGTGKTSLLRAITGELAPSAGQVVVGQNTRVAYFDQQRAGLEDAKSIWDNVVGDQPRIEVNGQVIEPRAWLERFLFDSHQQRQPVGSLSGGERARVALAKMLRHGANLVLLDEPTNDLDLTTLGALEQMLTEFGGTALVVTHDRWFLDRVATSLLVFEGERDGEPGRVVRHPGNWETFRRLREEEARARAEAGAPAPEPERARTEPRAAVAPRAKKGLTWGEQRELEQILPRIEAAEAELAKLEAKLADPATYASRGDEVRALGADVEKARAEVAKLTARWEELESKQG